MFQAPKLTDAGKNLYYRNMAGEGIKFTTIQLGNGTISGPISAMTALVSAVVTIDAAVKNNAEQYADVSGHFSNAELEEGFYWREIGVFAADPDYPNDRSHDILYCYQNAYDTADFIPVASVETVEKNITVPIIVGDASTVSCTLSSSQVLVSEADLEAHDKDANAHNALFEKINKELEAYNPDIAARPQLIAANKIDCIFDDGEENPIDRLKAEFEPKGIKVYPISAVTGQGLKELLYGIKELLDSVPAERIVFEQEFFPEDELFTENLPFTVERHPEDPDIFVVEGPKIEKMLGYTNLDSEKGFAFFQRFLKEGGILEELEKAGIEEGNTVRMYGFDFDYYK